MPPIPPWRLGNGRELALDRPVVVGVLNVTPDSFSDGGAYGTVDAAVQRAAAMLGEGADVIDVGGESTRPQGATPVDAGEERRRVEPVIRAIVQRFPDVAISVDTVKSDVARAAIDAGAVIVNDVSALRLDPSMAHAVSASRAGVVLMHSRGTVEDMATYAHAQYADVVEEVIAELRERLDVAHAAGIARESIVVDPGVGFAKRAEHSLAMLHAVDRLAALGYPVLVGASRKRFIGSITGVERPAERVYGTVGAHVAALARGARLFRVHDVAAARQSLDVAWAVLQAGQAPGAAA
ncbi:MAG TPA: dihydropteroate synthase [Gemmatimonadaceae bacterium]|nr:dihydropteroate synthase [Gemmatimonadaceae bacterium]